MVARTCAVVFLLLGAIALGTCAPATEEMDLVPAMTSDESMGVGAGAGAGAGAGDGDAGASAEGATPVNANEEPCLRAGGLCVMEDECPEGRLAEARGLCPAQSARGVECCHGLSIKERRCSARGGVCRPKQKCGRSLWEERAEDCASDEACCVLVS